MYSATNNKKNATTRLTLVAFLFKIVSDEASKCLQPSRRRKAGKTSAERHVMKIAETKSTVTTLDLTARTDRNVHGGSPFRCMAVVATVERGTFCGGAPTRETQAAHREALAKLGWEDAHPEQITRGCKSIVYLDQVATS